MSYWIYVTNSDNWAVTKKTNILGASARHKNALSRVNKGDKCLVYVKGADRTEPKIVAQYEIASTVFEDTSKMFVTPQNMPDESFQFRLRLKPVMVFEPPIEFKPLIRRLSFLPNKTYWTGPIRGKAMVQIPQGDYDSIISDAKT
ncbi:MAG: EVE domain-containing protein [Halobacteriota archaeon]